MLNSSSSSGDSQAEHDLDHTDVSDATDDLNDLTAEEAVDAAVLVISSVTVAR